MRRMPFLAFLLLGLAGTAAAQRPPAPPEAQTLGPGRTEGFIVDREKGCWLWMSGMPAESQDMVVTWTGACPTGPADGEGRSVLTWRERGEPREMVFDGTLRGGKAQGRGRLAHFRDGEPLVLESGDYVDDHLVQGRIELPLPGVVYEGGVLRGRPNGPGRLTAQGRSFEGTWAQGCLQLPGGAWLAFNRSVESCRETES
jgi:hypothetical protein